MLDVAEDMVKDPAELRALAAAAAHFAGTVSAAGGAAQQHAKSNGERRVQHIRVS
jgi:hypothetical protein